MKAYRHIFSRAIFSRAIFWTLILYPLLQPWTLRQGLAQVQNANPNYAKIREYGRIEWHGSTATLFAGSSRPLDMVALTLSGCFDLSISAEDPQYHFIGDMLDVTAPQWAAQHPGGQHVYAGNPGSVEITFDVNQNGAPRDLHRLLESAVEQVNRQQSNLYSYQLREDTGSHGHFYSFVPTSTHNQTGALIRVPPYLDQRITLPQQTARVVDLADQMTGALNTATGQRFSCCQAEVIGHIWGTESIPYHATDRPAREMLEDLMGRGASYILRCEPLSTFCAITLHGDGTVPSSRSGTCYTPGSPRD